MMTVNVARSRGLVSRDMFLLLSHRSSCSYRRVDWSVVFLYSLTEARGGQYLPGMGHSFVGEGHSFVGFCLIVKRIGETAPGAGVASVNLALHLVSRYCVFLVRVECV